MRPRPDDREAAAGIFRLPAMWRLRPCCHTCHVRCLLVDDNSAFIETARLLLAREGLVVAGTASSIAEALRQARLALLKRTTRRHPYYWAGFIQSGEWADLDGRR